MPRSLTPRAGLALLLAVLPLGSAGCGGPKLCRVTGTVRHAGKPVPHLIINFLPAGARPSTGGTDENGHYKLSYDREHEGALPGRHKIYVTYRPRSPAVELAIQQGKTTFPADFKQLLAKYGDADSTPLEREVTTDGQVIDLDLD